MIQAVLFLCSANVQFTFFLRELLRIENAKSSQFHLVAAEGRAKISAPLRAILFECHWLRRLCQCRPAHDNDDRFRLRPKTALCLTAIET